MSNAAFGSVVSFVVGVWLDLFCGFVGNVAGVDNSPTNGVGDGDEAVDKGTCHCLLEADLGDCGAEMGFEWGWDHAVTMYWDGWRYSDCVGE